MPATNEPWELDTRHLAALAAIARTRSISRAADELGYGQSAVSQQLAALERVVGHRLVDRGSGPRPVTLTAAGEVLLQHAQWILERLAAARAELDGLASGSAGSIRVGTFQSAGARLLPRVLAAYRRAWPAIAVSIVGETRDGEAVDLVRAGALDVAFTESAMLGPDLASRELVVDRYVALVPPGHRLAGRKAISLRELDGEGFVHGPVDDACTSKGEVALTAAGLDTHVVFRTNDNPTRQRLVDAGLGCAVLPGLTVEPGLPDGAVLLDLEEDIHRTICLAWSVDRTPSFALERFIETAAAVLADGGADARADGSPALPAVPAGGRGRRARAVPAARSGRS